MSILLTTDRFTFFCKCPQDTLPQHWLVWYVWNWWYLNGFPKFYPLVCLGLNISCVLYNESIWHKVKNGVLGDETSKFKPPLSVPSRLAIWGWHCCWWPCKLLGLHGSWSNQYHPWFGTTLAYEVYCEASPRLVFQLNWVAAWGDCLSNLFQDN